jgi:hypothetical protein
MVGRVLGVVPVLAVAGALVWWSLPPAGLRLQPPTWSPPPTVAGAIHVHTIRSDGTGTVDQIAAAAARAGLRFVVLTDHGDGTRPPEPPRYRHGVLCLDGVELSTDEGHYLAVGLPQTPYRLGGEGRAVVEDVRRLGGWGIVAHPVSPKDELRWREWVAPFDAIEWLNADSEWRDESMWRLAGALFRYPFRPAQTIASLFDRPELSLARWDALTRRRSVVAVAGVDAHARLSLPFGSEPHYEPVVLKIPSYEQAFRTFSVRVVVERPLSGRPDEDAQVLLSALREGRVFTVIDALAGPPAFDFFATTADGLTRMGGTVTPRRQGEGIELIARSVLPPGGELLLLRDGRPFRRATRGELREVVRVEPAVYRVEVRWPGAPGAPPVPWLVSNPIYVGRRPTLERPPPRRPARTDRGLYLGESTTEGWALEQDPTTRAGVFVESSARGRALTFRFTLGRGLDRSPFAALVRHTSGDLGAYDRIRLRARASQPLRMSVQLRADAPDQPERWHRSVYLDVEPRDVAVFFDELVPLGPTRRRRPPLAAVRAVLFVIDTTNTLPGTSAALWFDEVRLEGPGTDPVDTVAWEASRPPSSPRGTEATPRTAAH